MFRIAKSYKSTHRIGTLLNTGCNQKINNGCENWLHKNKKINEINIKTYRQKQHVGMSRTFYTKVFKNPSTDAKF